MSVLKRDAEREFDNLDVGTRELWEQVKRRQHNNMRPTIEATLIDAIQKYNSVSYVYLEARIDYCGAQQKQLEGGLQRVMGTVYIKNASSLY